MLEGRGLVMGADSKHLHLIGAILGVVLLIFGAGLAVYSQGQGALRETVAVTTDFSTITGLRKGSAVELAGIQIGHVSSIDFYEAQYNCDPATEDIGRVEEGRTNDCDPLLFCAPEGVCGKLEPWRSKELHAPCLDNDDCAPGAICVTKPFRRRYPRVYWAGWDDVCARYARWQNRVQVRMAIYEDKFHLIREDSRASVSSNSVLGDQIVSVTRGEGAPLPPGGRIQSTPSIYEDMEMFRDRIEVMTGKVDQGLSAISNVFGELNDDRVISEIKDRIAGFNEVTRQVAQGEGPVGSVFSDRAAHEFVSGLESVNETTREVDQFVVKANRKLAKSESELQPRIDDARQTMAQMRSVMADVRDPEGNHPAAKLLYDPSGERLEEIEGDIDDFSRAVEDVDEGKGALGAWVNEVDGFHTILDLFGFTARSDTLRTVNRFLLEQHERQQAEKRSR